MNSPISKLILGAAVATTLGACASLDTHPLPTRAELHQIHAGLTEAQVRDIAGKPPNVTGNKRQNETLWIYPFTDLWGYPSEFDVEFKGGVVADTYAERIDE